MGRNTAVLEEVKTGEPADKRGRVVCVPLTGDVEGDLKGIAGAAGAHGVDVFFDMSPPAAEDSGHLKAGIMALRNGGRVGLMGGIRGDIALPYTRIMHWNLTLKGKWMFGREDIKTFLQLVESGTIRLRNEDNGWNMFGSACLKKFKLEEWEEAFDEAERVGSQGMVVFEP
jgi:threonine dehydrogenase-like Zn-dependent dehydrogenase